jgi:acyl-CoA thioesterase-2
MTDTLDQIVQVLQPEEVVEDRYLGQSIDLGWGRLFGGHVLAQALYAASKSVDQGWLAHSLHAYFLRPGGVDAPLLYEVDRIRDGGSFATRRVVVRQKGEVILNMSASFHKEERGFEHQRPMPDVPGPDDLETEMELRLAVVDKIPEKHRATWLRERPIEMKPVSPVDFLRREAREPVQHIWMRTGHRVPDDPMLHRCLLAYSSDFSLLGTALLPHSVTYMNRGMQVASLDHAMHFHREFRVDEWLLYSMESPNASNALGYATGYVFDRAGRQVASVVQEGLIRRTEK